jgi:hypothetical protein
MGNHTERYVVGMLCGNQYCKKRNEAELKAHPENPPGGHCKEEV